jgi:hypothetical protein
MYFYWKTGPEGELWISRAALKDCLRDALWPDMECVDVSFTGSDSELTVAIATRNPEDENDRDLLARDLEAAVRPLGIETVRVSWARQPSLKERPTFKNALAWALSNPIAWGLAVGGLAAVIQLGAGGILIAVLWGLLGFLVSSLFLLERGRNLVDWVLRRFRKKS